MFAMYFCSVKIYIKNKKTKKIKNYDYTKRKTGTNFKG